MAAIPKTSRAACIVTYKEPLEIRDVPIPDNVEPGAILVKTEVASICGSDVHLWQGDMGIAPHIPLPVIGGHEMVGCVVCLGPGVTTDTVGQPLEEGDRIVWTHSSCGSCFMCTIAHQPTLCLNRRTGMFTNCETSPYLFGGFSEYCYVSPTCGRVKVPEKVPNELASAASCALRTVVHAFDLLGRIENWETVVVQGAGPLGLYAAAMAIQAGAHQVVVIGAPTERLAVAEAWGATHTINIDDMPNARERQGVVRGLTGKRGADIVIEVSGGATAFPEGIYLVRRGGRFLVVGQVAPHKVTIEPRLIVEKQIDVIGVMSGHTDHYYKAIQFVESNQDRFSFEDMLSNSYQLDQINDAMEAMRTFQEVKPLVFMT